LNSAFVNAGFSNAEKDMILTTTVNSDDKFSSYNVEDRVFLLSISEAERYFNHNGARQCEATSYARTMGASNYGASNNTCQWWLRSNGSSLLDFGYITPDGQIGESGQSFNRRGTAVRPAMWIDLNF
jgi:hypothetical protein